MPICFLGRDQLMGSRRRVARVPLRCPPLKAPDLKGSALRPYLAPLDEAEKAGFLERYLAAVAEAYPALADGTVLLPFPRLFVVASR